MKKITFLFLCIISSTFINAQLTVSPSEFEMTDKITITIDLKTDTGCNELLNQTPTKLYMHAGAGDDTNAFGFNVIGNWGQDDGVGLMTNEGNGVHSITLTPATYFNLTTEQITNTTQLGAVFRSADGSKEVKNGANCDDFFIAVGLFQLNLISPSSNTTIINSGDIFSINATTSQNADFTLKANNTSIDQKSDLTSYSYSSAITENSNFVLEANNGSETKSVSFSVIVKPNVVQETVPAGLKDGVNIDNNTITFVFYAPGKDFVHLIGSFNNYQIDNNYLLKKDDTKDRFWIKLNSLNPQTDYSYQYLIDGELRVADPYSTVVLTSSNDQYINETTYPNLPNYPTGKTEHHVTFLRFGDTPFNWQITNFQKPRKTDLVIYELLIRDFDALHSFDAVKARLDYLENLGVNAIEFMPLNEFDGNESWGYNPSFHMALDKYYGTQEAFKQLVDECHKRGIAVIVDVVFNHASGQHPYFRMWNTDNGGYQGSATNDNPFFNAVAQHPFNVFNDMNHSTQATKDYVKRITQFWIEEYKVDGFRYDLSKGFTQRFTNDVGVWGTYESERIAILKEYADYQWEIDTNSYVILEHFAENNEETELISYRLNEGKGIMVWGNHHSNYKEAALGNHNNNSSNFSWISYKNRGWTAPRNVSYMVSHDEERLMYENLLNGNSNGSYNTKELGTALDRMELNGAFYFTVPGPKMIWQFDELGYDISINQNGRTGNKPIKWEYFDDQNRKDIYNTWNKLIQLKLKYDVFRTSDFTIDASNSNGLKKIQLTDTNASDIQYVNIVGNFGITTQNINPVFQTTGVWYDALNENTSINVSNVNSLISLAPGEFRVYTNNTTVLATENLFINDEVMVFPNPARQYFKLNILSNNIVVYNLNGQKIKEFKGDFTTNTSFKVDDLNKGIYLIEIKNNKGHAYKKLIID